MHDFIYQFVLSIEYVSTCLFMFVFPSEAVMPVVGYAASMGYVFLPAAVVAGTVGTTLWAIMMYAIARRIGYKAVTAFVRRNGRFLGITTRNVDKAGRWFDRHARLTVFVGRFVPGLRTAVSIPAGFRRMPFRSFVLYTVLGSGIDSMLLAYLGYSAQAHFDTLMIAIEGISGLIIVGLCILAAAWLLRHYYRKKNVH